MAHDLSTTIEQLSLSEKAALTAGVDNWSTAGIPRIGLRPIILSDGPAGARGQTKDHESLTPSLCLPCASALGASFDPSLVEQAAAAVARQLRDKGGNVLLAPTVNLHRHPLWGRNFEAFSEDPLLSARLAVAYITGVQREGVAATVKHFVGNETEHERNTTSSEIDERTLRELYLLPFEYAVRIASVFCLMTGYNRLNGRFLPDDHRLIEGVLRGEWGFDGLVMTDWFALLSTAEAGRAGLDLEMPGPARSFGPALAEAVGNGAVSEADLDAKVRRLLCLAEQVACLGEPQETATRAPEAPADRPEDRALLRRAAAESTVLLANDGLLPLDDAALSNVALIGPNALRMSIMGGGSAKITPHYRLDLVTALRERLGGAAKVQVEAGTGEEGIAAAVAAATAAEVAIVVVGTDEHIESEGYDRESFELPGDQRALVRAVLDANANTVVVINSGAPLALACAERARALLQQYFAGQEAEHALVDVLFGDADPGGRLPTSFPMRIEHAPAFGNFPGEASTTRYGEGLLVGYRWYEARALPVRFPFGHGLSYANFAWSSPRCSTTRLELGATLRVEVDVANTSSRRGAEVVQCYVAPPAGGRARPGHVFRPAKELKAFAKCWLTPGEHTTVTMELNARSFAAYEVADDAYSELMARHPNPVGPAARAVHRKRSGWYVEPGTYELVLARSSADIVFRLPIEVVGSEEPLDASVLPI